MDPVDIADQLGVDVRYEALKELSGLTFHGDRGSRIVVNSRHSTTRKRFTLAHELGHHLLHKGRDLLLDPTTRVSRRDALSGMATDHQEIEANAFAAELLMPALFIDKALNEILSSKQLLDNEKIVRLMAREFGVSEEAMQYRLINLGIQSADSYY